MSKAIGNIQRNTLIEDRKNVLNQDKLHFIQYLLDVKIAVKSGICKSWFSNKDTEEPQGDCARTSESSFYLFK